MPYVKFYCGNCKQIVERHHNAKNCLRCNRPYKAMGRTTSEAAELKDLQAEIERLRAWIARTADDPNLNRKAGYHGRRVKLEAMSILCGKDVPAKAAVAAGGKK